MTQDTCNFTRRMARTYMRLLTLLVLTAIGLSGVFPVVEAQERSEPFDHFSTGFALDGAHLSVSCDGCHTSACHSHCQRRILCRLPYNGRMEPGRIHGPHERIRELRQLSHGSERDWKTARPSVNR